MALFGNDGKFMRIEDGATRGVQYPMIRVELGKELTHPCSGLC